MNLKILLPFQVFADKRDVSRVVAETTAGSYGFLPHRRDCVAALQPGILFYESASEGEVYLAVDEGVLVKAGQDMTISVRQARAGKALGLLREAVDEDYLKSNAQEQKLRSAMQRLEHDVMRRMAEFENGR